MHLNGSLRCTRSAILQRQYGYELLRVTAQWMKVVNTQAMNFLQRLVTMHQVDAEALDAIVQAQDSAAAA